MEMNDEVKKKRKRSFSENWLTDDRYKSWIRKAPFDDSLFHCIICDKNFSCSSSHVSRHAESACHKKNKEMISLNNADKDSSINIPKRRKYKQQFKPYWLENDRLKPWLREVPDNINTFFCSFCDKSITGGLSQIYRHAKTKLHIEKQGNHKVEETSTSKEQFGMQVDRSLLLFENRRKKAEIQYAAFIAENNIPHEHAKMILNFFQNVGKDPHVIRSMRMSRTKCTNIILNVLCPVETDRVVQNIQNTKFSVFIDNTSDISNEKWMSFFVRYVNPQTLDVHFQLVKLIDIDAKDCSAEKLFNALKQEMLKLQIPFSNIVALSCDNASVMTKKHSSFKMKLKEKCKNLLIFSCPCHSAVLAAHTACAKIPSTCEESIKKIAIYIKNSPKRTTTFREFCACFQEKNQKILKLSDIRWLSRYEYVQAFLKSWDTINNFLNEMVISEKIKSGELLTIMQKNIKAYLLFLKYILHFFNDFNTFFQAVETRIHLLYLKSIELLTDISKNFLKSKLLKDLPNIQFSENRNQKSLDKINLGSECEKYLNQLSNEGYIDDVANIRKNCLQVYATAAEEICKRLPVKDQFLCKLTVFQPQVALFDTDRRTSFNNLAFIVKTIGDFDENQLRKEWFTLHLDFTEIEKQDLKKLSFDDMWKKILQCETNNMIKYPNLRAVLNTIRSLPNSNTDPESISLFLSDIKAKKRNKLSLASINAICVLKSALRTREETILDMKIDAKHFALMSSDKLYTNLSNKLKNSLMPNVIDENDILGPSSSNDMR